MVTVIGWIEWGLLLLIALLWTIQARLALKRGGQPVNLGLLGVIGWWWVLLIAFFFTAKRIHIIWFVPAVSVVMSIWILRARISRGFWGNLLLLPSVLLFGIDISYHDRE